VADVFVFMHDGKIRFVIIYFDCCWAYATCIDISRMFLTTNSRLQLFTNDYMSSSPGWCWQCTG